MSALVGVVLGGVLTAVGSLIVATFGDRRNRQRQQTGDQLDAAREVLNSLQSLNRKMIDIARRPIDDTLGISENVWADYHEAATRWNSARYGAAFLCGKAELARLDELDREIDRLLGLAMNTQWHSRDFRVERRQLGCLAAAYLVAVRKATGKGPVALRTIWSWDIAD